MSRNILHDLQGAAYDLLRHIYREGGKKMKARVRVHAKVAHTHIHLSDGEVTWSSSRSDSSWSSEDMDCLVDLGLVSSRELSSGATLYRITQRGLMALRTVAEEQLCQELGVPSIRSDNVVISRAVQENRGLSGSSLDPSTPESFVERASINVWGRVKGSDEPLLIAKAQLLLIDAEGALHLGGFSLDRVLDTYPETRQYQELICNHELDGEPANHIYELSDMFRLEEAIGRQLIIVHDFRVTPALIGKKVGREILRRLIARYGLGGGIAIIPLRPYGVMGEEADKLVSSYLARGSFPPHVIRHPFVRGSLVGDIRKISLMP